MWHKIKFGDDNGDKCYLLNLGMSSGIYANEHHAFDVD